MLGCCRAREGPDEGWWTRFIPVATGSNGPDRTQQQYSIQGIQPQQQANTHSTTRGLPSRRYSVPSTTFAKKKGEWTKNTATRSAAERMCCGFSEGGLSKLPTLRKTPGLSQGQRDTQLISRVMSMPYTDYGGPSTRRPRSPGSALDRIGTQMH